jgi:hypothetical protein
MNARIRPMISRERTLSRRMSKACGPVRCLTSVIGRFARRACGRERGLGYFFSFSSPLPRGP